MGLISNLLEKFAVYRVPGRLCGGLESGSCESTPLPEAVGFRGWLLEPALEQSDPPAFERTDDRPAGCAFQSGGRSRSRRLGDPRRFRLGHAPFYAGGKLTVSRTRRRGKGLSEPRFHRLLVLRSTCMRASPCSSSALRSRTSAGCRSASEPSTRRRRKRLARFGPSSRRSNFLPSTSIRAG